MGGRMWLALPAALLGWTVGCSSYDESVAGDLGLSGSDATPVVAMDSRSLMGKMVLGADNRPGGAITDVVIGADKRPSLLVINTASGVDTIGNHEVGLRASEAHYSAHLDAVIANDLNREQLAELPEVEVQGGMVSLSGKHGYLWAPSNESNSGR